MAYIKAEDVLPSELIEELQKYIQGSLIYIPRPKAHRTGWGRRNGARAHFDQRNAAIRSGKACGRSLEELAVAFHLSAEAIRKVLYG